MTVHLLRGFVQWGRRGDPIKTVDGAQAWVTYIAASGFEEFSTVTTRRPRREAELKGGSVYFVGGRKRSYALFRMPFLRIEPQGHRYAIIMKPELIRVRETRVGKVRGWRYLPDADAPPDLSPEEAALPDWYLKGEMGDEP